MSRIFAYWDVGNLMKEFQGTLDSLEELALQNLFDDIFSIPSSNYLLEGKEPVEGFSANDSVWDADRVTATFAKLPSLRTQLSPAEFSALTNALFSSLIRSVHSGNPDEIDAPALAASLSSVTETFPDRDTILLPGTYLIWVLQSPESNPTDVWKCMVRYNGSFDESSASLAVVTRLMMSHGEDTADWLTIRWKNLPPRTEPLGLLHNLYENRASLKSLKETNLFSHHIASADDLLAYILLHDVVSPQQMHCIARSLLLLLDRTDASIFGCMLEVLGTASLYEDAVKSKIIPSISEVLQKTGKLKAESIGQFVTFAIQYFQSSKWESPSPTFQAFASKAFSASKCSLFFQTLTEEAKGYLAHRATQGLPLSELRPHTVSAISFLSTISSALSSGMKLKRKVHFHSLTILGLCCLVQAIYGEKHTRKIYGEELSLLQAKEALSSPDDSIPVSAFGKLTSDHQIINSLIDDHRRATKDQPLKWPFTIPRVSRIRCYQLNMDCPSPLLLHMALKDVSRPAQDFAGKWAGRLITKNLSAFVRMTSLMLGRAEDNELAELIKYLTEFPGKQSIVIAEPYLGKLIKEKPSLTGRFLLETLPTEISHKVEAAAVSLGYDNEPDLVLYLSVCKKLKSGTLDN